MRLKEIGTVYSEEVKTVLGTRDGGMLVGSYYSRTTVRLEDGEFTFKQTGGDGIDALLIKYEPMVGEKIEVKDAETINNNDDSSIEKIIPAQDGGYVVGGTFYSDINIGTNNIVNSGKKDVILTKYNVSGEIQWVKSIGGSGNEYISILSEIKDGSYIVAIKLIQQK